MLCIASLFVGVLDLNVSVLVEETAIDIETLLISPTAAVARYSLHWYRNERGGINHAAALYE